MSLQRTLQGLVVGVAILALSAGAIAGRETPPGAAPRVTVYKSPTCGCCRKWVDHLRANGFEVTAIDTVDVQSVKTSYRVPSALGSCHTAVVAGDVVEGHVPADVIRRVLAERPKVAGVAVPGMPMGSPGMEGPRREHYDVVAFDKSGKTSVYARR
jgi:hypothetical protein